MSSKKLSFKSKLTIGALLFGLVPMFISQIIGFQFNSKSLEKSTHDALIYRVNGKALEFKNLYQQLGADVRTLSKNIMTIDAIKELENSFYLIDKEMTDKVAETKRNESLRKFYESEFGNRFKEYNPRENSVSFNEFQRDLNSNALYAQYLYNSENTNKLGEKNKLEESSFDISYDKSHKKYHPSFNNYLSEYKYLDIFLIDMKGSIVYTAYKELDFATNLLNGKGSNFGLAQAYRKALDIKPNDKNFVFTDYAPYYYSYNVPAIFISYPIFDEGKMIGVLAMQVEVSRINHIFDYNMKWKESALGSTGQVYVLGKDKKLRSEYRDYLENPNQFVETLKKLNYIDSESEDYITNKKTTVLGLTIKDEYVDRINSGSKNSIIYYEDFHYDKRTAYFEKIDISGLEWTIVGSEEDGELYAAITDLRNSIGLQLLVSMVFIYFLSSFIAKRFAGKFSNITELLYKQVESVGRASDSIKQSSEELSDAGNQQASGLQQTVSSVDEISAMVSKNSDSAKQSKAMSEQSRDAAESGKKTIDQMIQSMGEINSSNTDIMSTMEQNNREIHEIVKVISEIGEKTKVINDIVFQTKLLSFNASVEAARAGEHGKGFAVVAEEVGNLAQMSGKASDEISSMLSNSINKVESIAKNTAEKVDKLITKGKERINHGTRVAQECGESLNEILQNVVKVNDMISEISIASSEQAQGIHEITKAMASLDQVTQQNAMLAQKTSNISQDLEAESGTLKEGVMQLMTMIVGTGKMYSSNTMSNNKETNYLGGKVNVANTTHHREGENSNVYKISQMKTRNEIARENKYAHKNSMNANDYQFKNAVGAERISETDNFPDKDDPRFEEV